MTKLVDQWWSFRAYNSETLYGWGDEEEANRYADHLNRTREINVYSPDASMAAGNMSHDENIASLESGERTDGINLADELAAIAEEAE